MLTGLKSQWSVKKEALLNDKNDIQNARQSLERDVRTKISQKVTPDPVTSEILSEAFQVRLLKC